MIANLLPVTFSQKHSIAQARACVKINGALYPIKSFQINKNAHGATNTASFVVSYAGNPDWTNQLFRGTFGAQSNNSPVYIELWAGFPQNPGAAPSSAGLSQRFFGVLDEYDPDDLTSTEFHCRSIASPLTTDRITTSVQNMTTVQFIKKICAAYNIPVVVDPELTNPFTLEQIYSGDYLVGLHNLVKWDVLLRSSWFDDVDVWEDGGVLYYVHPWNVATVVPNLSKILNLKYGQDVKGFKGNHAPQYSRNIRVTTFSYSPKVRVSVGHIVQSVLGGVSVSDVIKTSTATPNFGVNGGTTTTYQNDGTTSVSHWSSFGGSAQGSNAPISESSLEEYRIPLPYGLSATECQQIALRIWRQISQHEYSGDFELAVTPDNLPYLNIESRFILAGYGMSFFNTEYWPRTLDESFEMAEENSDTAEGWTVKSHAINHQLPLGQV
jgi:hypothetical protein